MCQSLEGSRWKAGSANIGGPRCLASGTSHSVAVGPMGSVFTWGCGADGQLGHRDGFDQKQPKLLVFLQVNG